MSTPISGLPAASTVQIADLVPIVQDGITKKALAGTLVSNLLPISSVLQAGIVRLGTTSGTACQGTDSRLSDSRTPTGPAGGDLEGSYPNPILPASGVAAGTFGSTAAIPVISVDSKGRITSATSAILSITSAQITGLSAAQVGAGITSAQINTLPVAKISGLAASATTDTTVATNITTGTLAAARVGTGLTSAQITGISITQVNSLGANVSTFLQTPTSANLLTAVTDETGTGTIVFSTSPTIATPTLTTPTINGYSEGVTTAAPLGSTYTLGITTSTVFVLTLASATPCTFTMPAASANKSFVVYLKQPASGTATTAVFTGVNWVNATAPTVTATLGRMDVFSFFSDGTKWFGNYIQNFTY